VSWKPEEMAIGIQCGVLCAVFVKAVQQGVNVIEFVILEWRSTVERVKWRRRDTTTEELLQPVFSVWSVPRLCIERQLQ
jgi:hypothetical protein